MSTLTTASVIASLAYVAPTTERPFNYMYEPPAGTPRENCLYSPSEKEIMDARLMASPPTVHGQGFTLVDASTSVADFTDEEQIRARYIAESEELAKAVTGADNAYVFDHLIRRREAGRPALNFGRGGDGSMSPQISPGRDLETETQSTAVWNAEVLGGGAVEG